MFRVLEIYNFDFTLLDLAHKLDRGVPWGPWGPCESQEPLRELFESKERLAALKFVQGEMQSLKKDWIISFCFSNGFWFFRKTVEIKKDTF